MIPKVIHYCWFGGKPLPQEVKQCIASWEKYCPDYEIRQWDESNFDVTSHPFMKAAYEAKEWAFVSDYARLKVVYENGGIYLDTDVELCKSLDGLLHHGAYFGAQQVGSYIATGLGFGAQKGHPAVLRMLQQYEDLEFDAERLEDIACPYLNTSALEAIGYVPLDAVQLLDDDSTVVYPPCFFDPLAPGDTQDLTCADTVSIHHYSASWTGKKNVLKRKLFRWIGEGRISRIKSLIAGMKTLGQGKNGYQLKFDLRDVVFVCMLLPLFKPVGLCTALPVLDKVYDAARVVLFFAAAALIVYRLIYKRIALRDFADLFIVSTGYQLCMLFACLLAGTFANRIGTAISCAVTVWVFSYLSVVDAKRLYRICAALLFALLGLNLVFSLIFPLGLNVSEVAEGRYQFLGKDNMYIWWALTAAAAMYLQQAYKKNSVALAILLTVITVTLLLYSSSTGTAIWLVVIAVLLLGAVSRVKTGHKYGKSVVRVLAKAETFISKLSFVKVMVVLGVGNFLLVFLDIPGLLSGVFGALTGNNATLSGRTDIWATMKRLILENPLFGTGKGEAVIDAYIQWSETVLYSHNFVLDIMVKGGLVTFAVFLVVLFFWNRRVKLLRKKSNALYVICMLLLLAYGIDGLMEGFEDATVFWAFLSMIYYYRPVRWRPAGAKGILHD